MLMLPSFFYRYYDYWLGKAETLVGKPAPLLFLHSQNLSKLCNRYLHIFRCGEY